MVFGGAIQDRISLYSPVTHSFSLVLGLEACTTTTQQYSYVTRHFSYVYADAAVNSYYVISHLQVCAFVV